MHRLLVLALILSAQDPPKITDEARQKAVEMLEAAAATVTSASLPEVQVAALMHIAENYQGLDAKKAAEYFQQAFTAAAPVAQRGELQAAIVRLAANVDLPLAIDLLRQMPPESGSDRGDALQGVVAKLIEKPDLDQAMALVEALSVTGDYPYRAVRNIFEKLPEDDPRRSVLIANAVSAYSARPGKEFQELLARHWREIPRPLAESALRAVVTEILERKDEGYTTQNISTVEGNVAFDNRKDMELFNLIHALKAMDPKRAEQILANRQNLKGAVERFPEGIASMQKGGSLSISTSSSDQGAPDPKSQAEIQLRSMGHSRQAAAYEAMSKDPQKALSIAKTIPVPSMQAEVLAAVARSVGEKDPVAARGVLNQCLSILSDIKEPSDRSGAWESVAEAAHKIQDEKLAWEAFDKALADAKELYKRDTDSDAPNEAIRETWPSTQNYRRIVARAAKLFGAAAEPLLLKITDPDLALLARIEMAQVLLGRPRTQGSTNFMRTR